MSILFISSRSRDYCRKHLNSNEWSEMFPGTLSFRSLDALSNVLGRSPSSRSRVERSFDVILRNSANGDLESVERTLLQQICFAFASLA